MQGCTTTGCGRARNQVVFEAHTPPQCVYLDRKAAAAAGVHPPTDAGICGGEKEGAESVVVSGGYVDDLDYGDLIVYTGQGGRDPSTKRQIKDQVLKRGSLALARSCLDGLPVRVIRGYKGDKAYAPASGYRYDGLYRVEEYWHDIGRDGFRIWRYRLLAIDGDAATFPPPTTPPSYPLPQRTPTTTQRIVRSTKNAERSKPSTTTPVRCAVSD
jgi:putative restriction endonuclease